jgi:hypothetical protein
VNLEEVVHPRRPFGHISEGERPGIAEGQERLLRPLLGLGFEQLVGGNGECHCPTRRLLSTDLKRPGDLVIAPLKNADMVILK